MNSWIVDFPNIQTIHETTRTNTNKNSYNKCSFGASDVSTAALLFGPDLHATSLIGRSYVACSKLIQLWKLPRTLQIPITKRFSLDAIRRVDMPASLRFTVRCLVQLSEERATGIIRMKNQRSQML